MASFTAKLHVAGYVIPLRRCRYGTHQETDVRGRASRRVYRTPVDNEADVPEHALLKEWTADPHQRLEAWILFRHIASDATLETLPAAYCVRYQEAFVSGDRTSGSVNE